MLKDILPKIRTACDLCCGTGTTALELASHCERVYGVDLSPLMCELARKKTRRARHPVRVIQADMRAFRLPEQVDLVTCEYDALNHVPAKEDLSRVARSVARALRPGGYFYFDVNNQPAFQKLWPRRWWMEKRGVVLLMAGGYDADRNRGFTNVEWFVRAGRSWRRFHEYVEEVAWSASEMRRTLREAGFGTVRAWDAAPLMAGNTYIQPGYRTFYLARKLSA